MRRTSRQTRLLHAGVYLTTLPLLLTGWWLLAGAEGHPSPLARVAGVADAELHVWLGWALASAVVVTGAIKGRRVFSFGRETFRVDGGDARWWKTWPLAVFTGRFARHEGRFDPGQRVANVILVGGLMVLTVTGIAMTGVHGGPTFVWLHRVHRWTTFVVTPVILGHILIAVGILPGYRGVWRAMHLGGRVPAETARRLWPGWTERALAGEERPRAPQADLTEGGRIAQPAARNRS